MSVEEVEEIATPLGPARMYAESPAEPRAVLMLGHGAGGGVEAPDLVALTALATDGVAVLRYEQPWRTAGKRVAPAPGRLDAGWQPARAYAENRFAGLPLFLGGRSAGARVACRSAAAAPGVRGIVALSFPLHPPGRPESSRAPELLGAGCPVLVLQGERDPFGTPAEVAAAVGDDPAYRIVTVPGCAHQLKPAKRAAFGATAVAELLRREVAALLA